MYEFLFVCSTNNPRQNDTTAKASYGIQRRPVTIYDNLPNPCLGTPMFRDNIQCILTIQSFSKKKKQWISHSPSKVSQSFFCSFIRFHQDLVPCSNAYYFSMQLYWFYSICKVLIRNPLRFTRMILCHQLAIDIRFLSCPCFLINLRTLSSADIMDINGGKTYMGWGFISP